MKSRLTDADTDSSDRSKAPRFEAAASVVESRAARAADPVTGAPFVGRTREMAVLRAALADAIDGRGRLVLLAGEPGIGKTRTAEEVAAHAHAQGMQVLWGRCYEGEGAPAFWPWTQLLRTASRRLTDDGLRAALGWGGAELAQLVPELRQRLPDLGEAAASDSAQARFRLFESVAGFLENLSRQSPLLCIIDDLHGGDRSSLLLGEFVARELRDVRTLLVGTYRDGAALIGHPLTELVVEALRLPGAERLTLSGLSLDEVAELVERTSGVRPAQAMVAAVHQQTEGNPLFASEYVRLLLARHDQNALADPGALRTLPVPESVRAVVRHRVAPLSSTCRTALNVAAVIGREFHRDVVETVVAGDAPVASDVSVFAALDEAAAAGIVGEGLERGGRYRFSHAVMREALYEELGSRQRQQLHRQVGEVLEQRRDAEEHLAELAHHYYQAGAASDPALAETDATKAVAYARRAGERAMAALAFEEALRLYTLALAAFDRHGVQDDTERRVLVADLDRAQSASHGAATTVEPRAATSAESEHPAARLPVAADAVAPPSARPRSIAAVFRREGDYWTIAYDGTVLRLKDTKGLQYIHHLLSQPGQELLAIDLVGLSGVGGQGARRENHGPGTKDHGLPMLDTQAKAEYRERLRDLRAELDEAVQFNDLGRTAKLQAEMDSISQQLSAAVGLHGRDRKSGAGERARLMVTKRIKGALKAIAAVHAPLAQHLRACVKTGYVCVYVPASPPVWWEV